MLCSTLLHPDYNTADMVKWRLTFKGGRDFIDRYLTKLSSRESDDDFQIRKDDAYCPAYAKSAVTDIKNAIYQRIIDIQRVGGPKSYQDAILSGVDLELNDMNTFIGSSVLLELLIMGRVGVLTDNPKDLGITLEDKGNKHPFLSVYAAENIRCWSYKVENNEKYFTSLLLCETVTKEDEYGLTNTCIERYRHLRLIDGNVNVALWEEYIDDKGNRKYNIAQEFILPLKRIPFTLFQIPTSLLEDVADYQKALLNLESSDISFSKKANFPIYYEFYDPKTEQSYKKPVAPPGSDGTSAVQNKGKDREVQVGLAKGRRFSLGTEAPGFVSPNPDTLRVSMEKGKQLREDIYRIVNLTVSNLNSSAESKQQDQGTLESGLSYIGSVLQKGENDIARHWSNFEGSRDKAKITYPSNYSIETEEQRQKRADHFSDMSNKVVSDTYRRFVSKQIAKITLGHRITNDDLKKIYTEIDEAPTLTCDPDQIIADHTAGLVGTETASRARGYPKGEVEKAKKDRAEMIKLTLEAQGGPQGGGAARGAPEFGGQGGSSAEKNKKKKRGTADKVIKDKPNG